MCCDLLWSLGSALNRIDEYAEENCSVHIYMQAVCLCVCMCVYERTFNVVRLMRPIENKNGSLLSCMPIDVHVYMCVNERQKRGGITTKKKKQKREKKTVL